MLTTKGNILSRIFEQYENIAVGQNYKRIKQKKLANSRIIIVQCAWNRIMDGEARTVGGVN